LKRRWTQTSLLTACVVASFAAACTFTRSLDYLTDGRGAPDSGSDRGETGTTPPGDPEAGLPANAETIAATQFNPRNLAQDATNLYWSSNDAILARAKSGGEPRTVVSAGAGKVISWIAADNTDVAAGSLYVIVNGEVNKVPKSGGSLTMIDNQTPKATAVIPDEGGSGAVFVTHADNASSIGFATRIGSDNVLARLSPDYWNPHGIGIAGPTLFVSGEDEQVLGVVYQLPKDAIASGDGGTTPAPTIIRGANETDILPDAPGVFAFDDESFFWYDSEYSQPAMVFRVSRVAGSSTVTPIYTPPEASKITHLVLDKDNVFMTDERAGGAVIRITKQGASPSGIAQNQPTPTSVLVDDRYVYFALQGSALSPDGSIVRIPK